MTNRPTAASSLWRDPLLWFLLAAGFVYGAVFNFLPVTFPVFRSEFSATLEQLGRTQMIFLISTLLVAALGGWFTARLGLTRAGGIALTGLGLGLFFIGHATTYPQVLAGCFCMGVSVACIVVASSALITGYFKERRQSVFFVFGMSDATGAIVGPAVLGYWLSATDGVPGSWRVAYWVAAAIPIALGIAAIAMRTPKQMEAKQSDEGSFQAVGTVLASPSIYVIGLAMFFHGVAQVGMVSWVGQFFQQFHGIGPGEAAMFVSANSAGFLIGRTILGTITARYRIPELVILGVCALCGTIAFALTICAPGYLFGVLAFAVAGLFISGDGPSLNSFVGRSFPANTATAFAVISGIGNIGGAAGPYLTGVIGTNLGIGTGIWMMPVFSLALSALALGWHVSSRRRTRESLAKAVEG